MTAKQVIFHDDAHARERSRNCVQPLGRGNERGHDNPLLRNPVVQEHANRHDERGACSQGRVHEQHGPALNAAW